MSHRFVLSLACVAGLLLAGAVPAQDHSEGHHHAFPKDIEAFHGVLGPLWHQPAGSARLQEACAQVSRLETLARQIRSRKADALVSAVGNLKAQCQSGPTGADAALTAVHDAFHGLIGQGKH